MYEPADTGTSNSEEQHSMKTTLKCHFANPVRELRRESKKTVYPSKSGNKQIGVLVSWIGWCLNQIKMLEIVLCSPMTLQYVNR